MSATTITQSDLLWILRVLENYRYYVKEFPEIVDDIDEDDLKVVLQMIEEKLDATK